MQLREVLPFTYIFYVPPPQRLSLLIVLSVWLWYYILRFFERYHIDVLHLVQLRHSDTVTSMHTDSQLHISTRRLAVALTKTFIPCHILSILIFALFENQDLSTPESIFFHSWPIIELALLLRIILKLSPTTVHYLKKLPLIEPTPRAVRNGYILIADSLVSLTTPLLDFAIFVLSSFKNPFLRHLDLPLSLTPVFVRIFQCSREYTISHDPTMPFNIIKYSLSIPTQTYTWYSKVRPNGDLPHNFHLARICLLLLNSSYTLFWDIRMDWNITSYSHNNIRGSKPQFPEVMYRVAIVLDFILRFWWLWITISAVGGFTSSRGFIFFPDESQYLEILRRALWVVFRLESELPNMPLGKQMA